MIETTLIYVEKDGKYLMLHRVSKKNDVNEGKWIGVGGKLEAGESPEDCARRELFEETGLSAHTLSYRAIVYFETDSDKYKDEEMHLFTCAYFSGTLRGCDEGVLQWVEKEKIYDLNLWEGDRIFLERLKTDAPFFRLRLRYSGDRLVKSELL